MDYTRFGNAKAKVSRLGLSCMLFPMRLSGGRFEADEELGIQIIRRASKLGINYFESGLMYCNGKADRILGKALEGKRGKVLIATGCPSQVVHKPGDLRHYLEGQLKNLNMGYVDYYCFQEINYTNFVSTDDRTSWYTDAIKAKSEGLIRHIACSCGTAGPIKTDPKDIIKLIDTGCFESITARYSLLDREALPALAYAKEKGMGVVTMDPLSCGKVSSLPHGYAEKLEINAENSVELGLRFVVSNPNIDIVLSGACSVRHIEEEAGYMTRIEPLMPQDIEALTEIFDEKDRLVNGYCTNCGSCMPCPQNVNIPFILRSLANCEVYGMEDLMKGYYSELGRGVFMGRAADACDDCGICERRCPKKIDIRGLLKKGHAALHNIPQVPLCI